MVSTRRGVLLNTECLECLCEEKEVLRVSYNQPPGLGRTQGWGLWADSGCLQTLLSRYLAPDPDCSRAYPTPDVYCWTVLVVSPPASLLEWDGTLRGKRGVS